MSNKKREWTPSPSSWELFLNLCPSRYPRLSEYCHIHDALESNFQIPKRKLPFIPLLTTAGVKDGGDLSSGQVSSHLASYRSKSIAQTPLEYQQTGGESRRKLMCGSCLPKLCLHKKGWVSILCSWHVRAHFSKVKHLHLPKPVSILRLPQLCPF